MKPRWVVICVLLIGIATGALGYAYTVVLPGFSIARQEPPALETDVATWLLRHSVPA